MSASSRHWSKASRSSHCNGRTPELSWPPRRAALPRAVMTGRTRRTFLADAGRLAAVAAVAGWTTPAPAWEPRLVGIASGDGKLEIAAEGTPWATYVYRDAAIPRPYFTRLCTPTGRRITRNHPPVAGTD